MKHIKVLLLSILCLLPGMKSLYAQDTGNGALSGEFSVSATEKVKFSQGNLQCRRISGGYEWRFASEQYERLDTLNRRIGTTNAWFDLFGYGASGGTYGRRSYYPDQTSLNCGVEDFRGMSVAEFIIDWLLCVFTPWCPLQSMPDYPIVDLYGSNQYSNNRVIDWGRNAIINGGNGANMWHSLSKDQWNYLMSGRTNAQNLKSIVTIQTSTGDVEGLLLLPDNATSSMIGVVAATMTEQAWKSLEAQGAVFLPSAGYRYTSQYYHRRVLQASGQYKGYYWTSSFADIRRTAWYNTLYTFNSVAFHFNEGSSSPVVFDSVPVCYGFSVRMARRCSIPVVFDYNNGWKKDTVFVNYGDPVPAAPRNPIKEENCSTYVFTGWNNNYSQQGLQIFSDVTFTAKYTSSARTYTVTFYNWDSTVISSQSNLSCSATPKAPTKTPKKNEDCDSTYAFTGWTPSLTTAQNCTAYYATFSGTVKKYRVSWQNWDGEELHYDSLENGNAISIPSIPTPERTSQDRVYTFKGWSPNPTDTAVSCSDVVITAVYESKPRFYQITWMDYNDTILRTESVEYNKIPDYGDDPVRLKDCRYTYEFAQWDPVVVPVAEEATYKAQYESNDRKYIVTWFDYNDDTLRSDTLECDDKLIYPYDDPEKPVDDDSIYFFDHWAPSEYYGTNIDGEYDSYDFHPVYTSVRRFYDVKFITHKHEDGDRYIESQDTIPTTVEYQNLPEIPAMADASYNHCDYKLTFNGWVCLNSENDTLPLTVEDQVTQDLMFVAQYGLTMNTYNMTWVELEKDTTIVQKFDSVLFVPEAADSVWKAYSIYVFQGWDPTPESLGNRVPCQDTTFTAQYKSISRYYKVYYSYLDEEEKVWKTDSADVEFGKTLNLDTVAVTRVYCDSTYTFVKWNPALETVTDTSNYVFTAVYSSSANTYTVTWLNWNDTVVFKETLEYNAKVNAPLNPKKTADDDIVWLFDGWTPEPALNMPCEDTVYKATFHSVSRYYDDTIVLHDTTVVVKVEYDSVPKLDSLTGAVEHCDSTYTFDHWSPQVRKHDTVPMTYVAVYKAVPTMHTVTWKNWDGSVRYTEDYELGKTIKKPTPNPTRDKDGFYVYFFKGWLPEHDTMPCGDVTFEPQFEQRSRFYKDTLVRHNDTIIVDVEYGTKPNINNYKDTVVECDSTFTFDHWEPADTIQDTVAIKFVAVYEASINSYPVTWYDGDGTIIETTSYKYGATVIPPLVIPTKATEGGNVYFFVRWEDENHDEPFVKMPCEELVYTPVFDNKARYYYDTVYLKYDTIYPVSVEYDSTPDLSKWEYPIVDCDYTYTFDYWDPIVGPQPADTISYRAVYTSSLNSYPLIWKNWDGSTYFAETKHYQDNISSPAGTPVRPTDDSNVYFFSGWYPTPVDTMPCGKTEYTAQFDAEPRYYQDTLILADDTIYPVETEYDSVPDFSEYEYTIVHCDSTYTFKRWEPALGSHPADTVTYKAIYDVTPNSYTLTWKNWDGSTYFAETKHYQDNISSPAGTPVHQTDSAIVYFFTGWYPTPDTTMPCGNTVYTAQFDAEPRYYQDTLILADDTIYPVITEFDSVPDFSKYEYTIVHCDSTYEFDHWEPALGAHPADTVTYKAIYKVTQNTYSLTWKNWDGSTYFAETKHYQDNISSPAGTPVRPSDDSNVYFFTGWLDANGDRPVTTMPCGNTVYTAQFDAEPRYYQDTLILKDDTIPVIVEYDSVPDFSEYEYPIVHCDSTYTFNHWEPALGSHPADTVTYKAIYDVTPNSYTLTWKNWDGSTYFAEVKKFQDNISLPAGTPVHPTDSASVYFFTGWLDANGDRPVTTMPCNDLTYTAQYIVKARYYTDSVVLKDTTIAVIVDYDSVPDLSEYTQTVVHCDSTFKFLRWSPKVAAQDTVYVEYVAEYLPRVNKHNVTWLNWNGDTIKTDAVNFDSLINEPVTIPTRPKTEWHVYFFTGWAPEFVKDSMIMPCEDLTYMATFEAKDRNYKDTIVRLDDTVYVAVEYGTIPRLDSLRDTILRCDTLYEWVAWTPETDIQDTFAVSYTAVYRKTPVTHNVTWKNWDGSVLYSEALEWKKRIFTPADPTRGKDKNSVYFFDHWNPTPDTVMPCEDVIYTAIYSSASRYYRDTVVRFGNDTIVPQILMEYGQTPEPLLSDYEDDVFTDCYNTYTFRAWNPQPAPQDTVPVTYVADYDTVPNTYIVSWANFDGSVLRKDTLLYEAPIIAPDDPTRPQDTRYTYSFNGWSPEPDATMPCHDVVYLATYARFARSFNDTVYTNSDTLLIAVQYGDTPDLTQYQDTVIGCGQSYLFHHWSPVPGEQDTVSVGYHAVYSTYFNKYSVTWMNDGSYYSSDTLQYGARVYVPDVNPTRLPDSTTVYFFDHWEPTPALTMPCKDMVYSAVYASKPRFYDIPVHTMDYDTVITSIEYGEDPSTELARHEGTVVHCDSTFQFMYWTPTPSPKDTSYVEYTAVYDGDINSYNITWMNGRTPVATTSLTYGALFNSYGVPVPTRAATRDSIYVFDRWSYIPGSRLGCGDTTIYAIFSAKSAYIADTIVLKDTVIVDSVPFNTTPDLDKYEQPVVHCDYTYTFSHWSPDPETMLQPGEPVVFTAVYDSVLNDYYITWVTPDTTQIDTLHCGDVPVIADPTKSPTCDYIYTFSNWTPQVVPVTGDATYTAVFSQAQRLHEITWYAADGSVFAIDSLPCNATPVPTCQYVDGGDSANYRLTGWYPAIHAVDGDFSYFPVFDTVNRIVTYDSTLNYVLCMGDSLTLPSGKKVQVTFDGFILDTVVDAVRKPYEGLTCYNNDSLVDLKVYAINVAYFKNPLDGDLNIACPDQIVEGMAINVAQAEADIKAAFVGAYDELVPDWANAQWMIKDVNGNWVVYTGTEIRDREVGDTVYMKYVIPTNCIDIVFDVNKNGCDMSLVKANADNCPYCQNDSAVIAVYDWLLMYEHVKMQSIGYNVTPDKVYWFAIGGNDWDNLADWTIPMAIDDEYLGNGYYYTLNQPFNGTGDYYALVDVTDAGDRTLPCLGIMRSQKFHYAVAKSNAPVAQIYPTEVRNSDVVYVVGLDGNVKNDIYVYDMAGKLVSHDTVTDDHFEFRAAGAAGTYRVVVISDNNKQTLSFIIL